MDHARILKRALQITWNYRVLWVFGILLALTSGGRGGGSNGGGGSGGSNNGSFPPPGDFHMPDVNVDWQTILPVMLGILCLVVFLVILFTILRYVSETALIRMVDGYEASGEKISLRQGFSLGWSRAAFRIFLIDLLIGLTVMVGFLLLMALAAAPLLVWLTESEAARIIGSVVAAGLFLMVILVFITVIIAVSLLIQFIRRAIVLENLDVSAGFRRGLALLRQRIGDVLIMGILIFALGLVATILMFPVMLVLVMAGAMLGGVPGLLTGWLASLFAEGALPWIAGVSVGLPIFLAIVVLPALFLGGLIEVYKSSTWTLTYRELLALEAVQAEPVLGD